MSEIFEFPLPTRKITEAESDRIHARAFRDLEDRISDCATMSEIALEMAEKVIEGTENKHAKAMFAISETAKMLKCLKADYQAAWHN